MANIIIIFCLEFLTSFFCGVHSFMPTPCCVFIPYDTFMALCFDSLLTWLLEDCEGHQFYRFYGFLREANERAEESVVARTTVSTLSQA